MEGRKWEELNIDCLVKVFEKVGLEGMMFEVPFVCKSWYKASLDPECWKDLNFSLCCPRSPSQFHTKMIKFAVDRSCGTATRVVLHGEMVAKALIYVSDRCPMLKCLALPANLLLNEEEIIPDLIQKWKDLELLRLGTPSNLKEILNEISIHCKIFVALIRTNCGLIEFEEASTIVDLLPKIKYLSMRNA